jgi:predicted flap endonuclease-1-like 5' DNA nuclease
MMVDGRRLLNLMAASFDPHADLTAGWRYTATLQLRTPLAYLEKDGEFSPGPGEPPLVGQPEGYLPDGTGFNPYGFWAREIDYEGLGFPPPDFRSRATEWGPVQIGSEAERDLLSLLKSFRYIVETAQDIDQALSELVELSTSTERNQRTWAKLKKADPLFPDSFFIEKLQSLPGIGAAMAEKLYRSGIRSVAEVQSATDSELLLIPGFGKGLLRKIREQ